MRRAPGDDEIDHPMLMRVDPDVHFHVLPRYANERSYPGLRFVDADWSGPPQITRALEVPETVLAALRTDLATDFDP